MKDLEFLIHEIKNPLNSIYVNLQILREKHPEEDREIIEQLIKEIDRVKRLLDDFKKWKGRLVLKKERVNLKELINKVAVFLSPQFSIEGCEIEVKGEDVFCDVDPDKIAEVFLNLFLNSKEAGARRITVKILAGHPVVVEVEDDGPGVPEEFKEKIFSPFFTTKKDGTGLGLSIVKEILEAHRGRIYLKNRNTFVVELSCEDSSG